jgi:hypothetical protein
MNQEMRRIFKANFPKFTHCIDEKSKLRIPYRVGGRGGWMVSGNWYFEERNGMS